MITPTQYDQLQCILSQTQDSLHALSGQINNMLIEVESYHQITGSRMAALAVGIGILIGAAILIKAIRK